MKSKLVDPKRLLEDTPSSRLLAQLKAIMARSERERGFGPAACRVACLEAIDDALSAAKGWSTVPGVQCIDPESR